MFGHAGMFAVAVLGRCESRHEPLFRPEDVMTVEMAGPMAEVSRMPQKAERAPDPMTGSPNATELPPPNPSDMAFRTPDAPTTKGIDAERQKLIDDMRRRALLDGLDDAPVGEVDRLPTGESGEGGPVQIWVNDPETAGRVRARLVP